MQSKDRTLGGGGRRSATLENTRSAYQKCRLPLMNHRRMDFTSGHQIRHRRLTRERLSRLERRVMALTM